MSKKTAETQENSVKNENNSNINEQNSRAKRANSTVAIVGHSIIFGIREDLLTANKHKVIVRFLRCGTVEVMTDSISPILKRVQDFIILHAGTNKGVSMTS